MMQRYDTYKDSGVQWLGQIPGHWDCVRLKHTGTCRNGLTYNPIDEVSAGEGTLVLRSSNIQDGKLSYKDNVFVKTDIEENLYLKANDILICSRNGSRDLVGKLVRIEKDLDCTFGAFMMVYRTELWSPFMAYSLQVVIANYKNLFSTSTINQLVKSKFENFRTPLPPLPEQRLIVSYLDEKCEKLDKLIAAKERKIELLGEMKQRVISDAVTRGLNPNVNLKDTNIPWLPKVPEHWEVSKLKRFCKDNKVKNKENIENNVLSLSYGKIIRKQNLNEGLLPENYEGYQIVQPGYIVMRLTDLQNDHRSLRTGLVKEKGIITSAYVGLIVENIDSEYTHLLLHSYDVAKVYYSMGGGLRQSMNYQDVANLPICIPPKEEQREIVSYISSRVEKIDTLVGKLRAEIEHIKEYKQRLISDVVTGQIKVS